MRASSNKSVLYSISSEISSPQSVTNNVKSNFDAPLSRKERFYGQPFQSNERKQLIAVAPVEHDLKQRGIAKIALGLDSAHNLIKRNRTVEVKVQSCLLNASKQFAKSQVS